jgi:hypothetical protein
MSVAMQVHPPARHCIKIIAPFGVEHMRTLRPHDMQGRSRCLRLRERMPAILAIEIEPVHGAFE